MAILSDNVGGYFACNYTSMMPVRHSWFVQAAIHAVAEPNVKMPICLQFVFCLGNLISRYQQGFHRALKNRFGLQETDAIVI